MDVVPPSFDLDAYASRYRGRTKIQRLRFIASQSPELRRDALLMALHEAKEGFDTLLYRAILTQASSLEDPAFAKDENWIFAKDHEASQKLARLRYDLEDSKAQSNKEVIRALHAEIGDFFRMRGKLQASKGEYAKTRDYCTHSSHSVIMCLKVITVSIEADDFTHVENHLAIAENTPLVDISASPPLSFMRACSGLAFLIRGNYQSAAMRFLKTSTEANEEKLAKLCEQFGDVLSLEDVATYGSLCALATMDRQGLKKSIIDSKPFRNLLELMPNVREMVFDFYHSRYTQCLDTMSKLRKDLMLDMFLGREEHIDNLYHLIRGKALVQYVYPFLSADMNKMAKVFKTSISQLEEELLEMIDNGTIQARIDTQNRVLYAKRKNHRLSAMKAAVAEGENIVEEIQAMLIRMELVRTGLGITDGANVSFQPSGSSSSGLGGRGRSANSIVDNVFERCFRHV